MANKTLQELFGDNAELTASINVVPVDPSPIAKDKIFAESGIPTTSAFIEFAHGIITLVPAAPRGGVGEPYRSGPRTGIEVEAVHLPHTGSVFADEVQDRRGFGGVSLETPQQLLTRKMSGMRLNIEATLDIHRLGAIKGTMLDADGSTVLLDTYAAFGIEQTSRALFLSTSSTNLLKMILDAERASEATLGGTVPDGFLAYCAPDFMDDLRAHPAFVSALEWGRPSELTTDYRSGIRISNTLFKELGPFGSTPRIESGTAYLIPRGVQDLFLTRFAPADWNETVNTPGLPLYLKSQPMPMDRGFFLEAQSNPINICTRPSAVIKLTAN